MSARIEIDIIATNRKALSDRTSPKVRGSKWGRKTDWWYYPVPHPYGARIETKQIRNIHLYVAPIRACGLKLHNQYDYMQPPKVAPLQVCVLKSYTIRNKKTIFTPLIRCADRNEHHQTNKKSLINRTLIACADRNTWNGGNPLWPNISHVTERARIEIESE